MPQASVDGPAIKAYWQPGCTSCLRMKEFLTKHGVAFVSVNVLEDKDAFAELAALGVRSVPIVRRGSDWANGQVLRDVARVAGIAWGGAQMLPPDQLAAQLVTTADAAACPTPRAPPEARSPAAVDTTEMARPNAVVLVTPPARSPQRNMSENDWKKIRTGRSSVK